MGWVEDASTGWADCHDPWGDWVDDWYMDEDTRMEELDNEEDNSVAEGEWWIWLREGETPVGNRDFV